MQQYLIPSNIRKKGPRIKLTDGFHNNRRVNPSVKNGMSHGDLKVPCIVTALLDHTGENGVAVLHESFEAAPVPGEILAHRIVI